LWLVLALPVALLVYHFAFVVRPDWEWRLPYSVQYYYGPVAWGVLLGCFVYFAGFGGAVFVETRHPQRWKLGVAMLLLTIAVQQFHWRTTTRVVPATREPVVTFEGLVFQTSAETCVPAAAASLLAALGDRRTEAELVERMGTDMDGTLPSQMVMAMRRLGYRERTVSADRDGLGRIAVPAVVFLKDNRHAVTLLRHDQRGAWIWDPGRGRLVLSRERFRHFMEGAHAVHFARDDSKWAQR
jgi:predicted double-glycine peptidase